VNKIAIIFLLFFSFSTFGKDCGVLGTVDQRLSDCENQKTKLTHFSIVTNSDSNIFLLEKGTTYAWSPVVKSYLKCRSPYKRPKLFHQKRVSSLGLKVSNNEKRCFADLKNYILINLRDLEFEN
jgi:hypothetical protein